MNGNVKVKFDEIDQKIENLSENIQVLHEAVETLSKQLDEQRGGLSDKFERNRASIQSVYQSVIRYGKIVNNLEKRMASVKNDASTGVILVIVIFAALFVFSIFIR